MVTPNRCNLSGEAVLTAFRLESWEVKWGDFKYMPVRNVPWIDGVPVLME